MNPIVTAFAKGVQKSGIKPSKISVASDIPFDPEVVDYLGTDFFHTIRGRAIAFGTGLKLGNPALKVVLFVGDLITLGGNHFVHAGRRNMELLVICVNNFVYRRVGGQPAPLGANPNGPGPGWRATSVFSPYSTFEEPFNIPHLANSCGAVYTARWTALHTDELADSVSEALKKRGFSAIEVLSPGPNYYAEIREMESDLMNFYYENSVVRNGEDPRNVAITPEGPIVVGRFTDKERPTFIDSYNAQLGKILGDKFIKYGGENG